MRPPRGIRRDLRLSLGDAAGYGAMAGVAEVYLPAFGLALGMPPVLAGLVARRDRGPRVDARDPAVGRHTIVRPIVEGLGKLGCRDRD